MAIIDPKVDMLYSYRYKINKVYIIFPISSKYDDTIVELPAHRVNSFVKLDNFIENVYPVICLNLSIEESLYERIIEFKTTVKFQIDMRKFYINQDTAEESMYMRHINKTFSLILDDAVNTVNKSIRDAEFTDGDTNELQGISRNEDFFLFAADVIRANTSLINGVLRNATPADAVSTILSAGAIRKNLIMPSVANTTVYPYLVIPPLRITRALSFIESYYGLFRTGSIIYFGMDRNYIIPYCIRSRAVARNEPETVNIVVPQLGSALTDSIGSATKRSESNTPYVIADSQSFEPSEQDVTNQILYPIEIDVMDNEYGVLTTEKSSSAKNKTIIINPGENPFYKESYELRKRAVSTVITISVKNCDLSLFTPNKVYQFLFEDIKLMRRYKGKYHLVNIDIGYAKVSDVLEGGATMTFHRNVG